jgi:hypothetical protein
MPYVITFTIPHIDCILLDCNDGLFADICTCCIYQILASIHLLAGTEAIASPILVQYRDARPEDLDGIMEVLKPVATISHSTVRIAGHFSKWYPFAAAAHSFCRNSMKMC